MGGSSSQSTAVNAGGSNGQRIFSSEHTDIDESTIDIACTSGSCRVTVEERIWYSWVTRFDNNLTGPNGRLNQTIEVDSDFYDADHRLVVIATANGTQISGTFESTDR